MNNQYTDISIVQDKSGSMAPLANDTIGGYNRFIADQKKVPGKCTVTLTQFDTVFHTVYDGKDIQQVPDLNATTYNPSGGTALLDAIADTIQNTGARLKAMPENERPARVVIVITTDGEENSSREYRGVEGRQKVMDMIKHQTDVYKWQFIFLGANQDAIQAGAGIGIGASNAISTAATKDGVHFSYSALSANLRDYRTSASPDDVSGLAFKTYQRTAQKTAGAADDALNKTT